MATVAQVHAVLAVATVLNDILTRMPEPTRNIRQLDAAVGVGSAVVGAGPVVRRSCGCTTDGGSRCRVDAEPAAFGNVFVDRMRRVGGCWRGVVGADARRR